MDKSSATPPAEGLMEVSDFISSIFFKRIFKKLSPPEAERWRGQ
jgi:hypothetical protein